MNKNESNKSEMPDFGELADEMEDAMVQARKAMDELPPLEELSGIQQAMVGLARMSSVVEKIRLAAEKNDELIAELVGEPDWRVEAEIEVGKGASPPMKVRLTADFDLEIIVQAHEIASADEAQAKIAAMLRGMGLEVEMLQEQVARGRGMALIRDLTVLESHITPGSKLEPVDARLTPEANVPLKISDERELCFEFAPALKMSLPRGDLHGDRGDFRDFTPTIDEVRVPLDSFEPGKPFGRGVTVSREDLELEFGLIFRPL